MLFKCTADADPTAQTTISKHGWQNKDTEKINTKQGHIIFHTQSLTVHANFIT